MGLNTRSKGSRGLGWRYMGYNKEKWEAWERAEISYQLAHNECSNLWRWYYKDKPIWCEQDTRNNLLAHLASTTFSTITELQQWFNEQFPTMRR